MRRYKGELDIAYNEIMLDDYDFDGSQRSYYIWDIVDEKLNEAPFITYTDNAREKREQFKMLAQEQYEGDTK